MPMSEKILSEKQIQRRVLFDKISFVLIAVFLALSTLFSVTLIFQKTYFEIKWINGQSMYPTFNADAVDRYGHIKGKTGGKANNGDKNLDCVIWDGHQATFDRLERFDIVIASQPNNPSRDLIKRVLAMPGETFYFGSGDDNGSLYLQNKNGEFEKVNQPVQQEFILEGSYAGYQTPTTLGKNEYFICGDNRGYSSDSRSFGPVSRQDIAGIVVAVIGTADTTLSGGEVVYTNLRIGWPRWIK